MLAPKVSMKILRPILNVKTTPFYCSPPENIKILPKAQNRKIVPRRMTQKGLDNVKQKKKSHFPETIRRQMLLNKIWVFLKKSCHIKN